MQRTLNTYQDSSDEETSSTAIARNARLQRRKERVALRPSAGMSVASSNYNDDESVSSNTTAARDSRRSRYGSRLNDISNTAHKESSVPTLRKDSSYTTSSTRVSRPLVVPDIQNQERDRSLSVSSSTSNKSARSTRSSHSITSLRTSHLRNNDYVDSDDEEGSKSGAARARELRMNRSRGTAMNGLSSGASVSSEHTNQTATSTIRGRPRSRMGDGLEDAGIMGFQQQQPQQYSQMQRSASQSSYGSSISRREHSRSHINNNNDDGDGNDDQTAISMGSIFRSGSSQTSKDAPRSDRSTSRSSVRPNTSKMAQPSPPPPPSVTKPLQPTKPIQQPSKTASRNARNRTAVMSMDFDATPLPSASSIPVKTSSVSTLDIIQSKSTSKSAIPKSSSVDTDKEEKKEDITDQRSLVVAPPSSLAITPPSSVINYGHVLTDFDKQKKNEEIQANAKEEKVQHKMNNIVLEKTKIKVDTQVPKEKCHTMAGSIGADFYQKSNVGPPSFQEKKVTVNDSNPKAKVNVPNTNSEKSEEPKQEPKLEPKMETKEPTLISETKPESSILVSPVLPQQIHRVAEVIPPKSQEDDSSIQAPNSDLEKRPPQIIQASSPNESKSIRKNIRNVLNPNIQPHSKTNSTADIAVSPAPPSLEDISRSFSMEIDDLLDLNKEKESDGSNQAPSSTSKPLTVDTTLPKDKDTPSPQGNDPTPSPTPSEQWDYVSPRWNDFEQNENLQTECQEASTNAIATAMEQVANIQAKNSTPKEGETIMVLPIDDAHDNQGSVDEEYVIDDFNDMENEADLDKAREMLKHITPSKNKARQSKAASSFLQKFTSGECSSGSSEEDEDIQFTQEYFQSNGLSLDPPPVQSRIKADKRWGKSLKDKLSSGVDKVKSMSGAKYSKPTSPKEEEKSAHDRVREEALRMLNLADSHTTRGRSTATKVTSSFTPQSITSRRMYSKGIKANDNGSFDSAETDIIDNKSSMSIGHFSIDSDSDDDDDDNDRRSKGREMARLNAEEEKEEIGASPKESTWSSRYSGPTLGSSLYSSYLSSINRNEKQPQSARGMTRATQVDEESYPKQLLREVDPNRPMFLSDSSFRSDDNAFTPKLIRNAVRAEISKERLKKISYVFAFAVFISMCVATIESVRSKNIKAAGSTSLVGIGGKCHIILNS